MIIYYVCQGFLLCCEVLLCMSWGFWRLKWWGVNYVIVTPFVTCCFSEVLRFKESFGLSNVLLCVCQT